MREKDIRDSTLASSIFTTQAKIPLAPQKENKSTFPPACVAFKESRSDSLPKLDKLLPQFSTNHRAKDGTPSNSQNEAPVADLLANVLTQLSPAKVGMDDNGNRWENLERISDYKVEKTIGEGAHGKVKLAIHVPTG